MLTTGLAIGIGRKHQPAKILLNMTHTVAQALAKALARHGVTTVFGQSLPSAFFLAAPDEGIRQVVYRTENAGGAMADGFARVTNTTTIVGAQNGPAATLLVPPFAEALKASIPIIGFVQDVPRASRDRNAFQDLDHFELFRGVTKWIRRLEDPARVDEYVDQAFVAANSGRPGPVVLLLPKDLLNEPAGESPSNRTAALRHFPLDPTRPAAEAVSQAAAALASAERPVIIAGGGVHLSGAYEGLAELRDALGAGVATTNMGKGAVDEGHPLSIGVVGNFMAPTSPAHHLRQLITEADVVLLVGSRTNENGTDAWTLLPRGATFIHLDVDPQEIGRNYESIRLVGDAELGLHDLAVSVQGLVDVDVVESRREAVSAAIAEGRAKRIEDCRELRASTQTPMRPERVMWELDQLLTDDAIVVADASYSTIWIAGFLTARRTGQRFVSPRGLAGLGWGLPMALGAKAAYPDKPVVCVVGDGGFGHVWAELETSVREGLPIVLLVLNNSILGFQKHAELSLFKNHTNAIDFVAVDHAAIARAVGANGVRVDTPDELPEVLSAALASGVTTLIELNIEPDAYPPLTLWQGKEDLLLSRPRGA